MSRRGICSCCSCARRARRCWSCSASTRRPGDADGGGLDLCRASKPSLNDVDESRSRRRAARPSRRSSAQPDGWTVMERNGYPADIAKLRQNLRRSRRPRFSRRRPRTPSLLRQARRAGRRRRRRHGRRRSRSPCGARTRQLDLRRRRGHEVPVRAARGRGAELPDRPRPGLPARQLRSGWIPTILDVRRHARPASHDQAPGRRERHDQRKPRRRALNFDVADVPKGRELLYPGRRERHRQRLCASSSSRTSRPRSRPTPDGAEPQVEFRTFDGLIVTRARARSAATRLGSRFEASFDPDQAARFAKPPPTQLAKRAEALPTRRGDAEGRPAPKRRCRRQGRRRAKPAWTRPRQRRRPPSQRRPAEAHQINEHVGRLALQDRGLSIRSDDAAHGRLAEAPQRLSRCQGCARARQRPRTACRDAREALTSPARALNLAACRPVHCSAVRGPPALDERRPPKTRPSPRQLRAADLAARAFTTSRSSRRSTMRRACLQRLGNEVLLKREDLQAVFSFKLRGAYNKIAQLPRAALERGVICSSAGNHAQGVALAARKHGVARRHRDAEDHAAHQGRRRRGARRRSRARGRHVRRRQPPRARARRSASV